MPRRRIASLIPLLLLMVAWPVHFALSQPAAHSAPFDPYAGLDHTVDVSESPVRQRPLRHRTFNAAETARRGGIVVSAGTVQVSIGELEDALLESSAPRPADAAHALAERRAIALQLLHAKLLEHEALRRHLDRAPQVHITVRNALANALLERDFGSDSLSGDSPGEVPADGSTAEPPVVRRGIVLFAPSRDAANRFPASEDDLSVWDELASRASLQADGVSAGDTPWLTETARPEDTAIPMPFPMALREALFQIREYGMRSQPIRVGTIWAVIVLSGERQASPADDSQGPTAWEQQQADLSELKRELREQHLGDVDPEPLYLIHLAIPQRAAPQDRREDPGFENIHIDSPANVRGRAR